MGLAEAQKSCRRYDVSAVVDYGGGGFSATALPGSTTISTRVSQSRTRGREASVSGRRAAGALRRGAELAAGPRPLLDPHFGRVEQLQGLAIELVLTARGHEVLVQSAENLARCSSAISTPPASVSGYGPMAVLAIRNGPRGSPHRPNRGTLLIPLLQQEGNLWWANMIPKGLAERGKRPGVNRVHAPDRRAGRGVITNFRSESSTSATRTIVFSSIFWT